MNSFLRTLWCAVLLSANGNLSDAASTAKPGCTALIPANGPYNVLRSRSSDDMRLAFEDKMCDETYATHNQAINDGFSVGFPVYGVPVQAGGTFDSNQTDTWKHDHCDHKHIQFSDDEHAAFESLTVDKYFVHEVTRCMIHADQRGLGTDLEPVDGCKFTFTAWYTPNRPTDKPPRITSLDVKGGICEVPPSQGVPYGGFSVGCQRNLRDSVVVTLNTDAGNDVQVLDPLPALSPEPQKPVEETQNVDPLTKVCNVQRAGMSYSGSCIAGGPITSATYDCAGGGCGWCYGARNHSRGADWDISGNVLTWYRYCEGDQALMTYTVHYNGPKSVCVQNCDYDTDHRLWEQQKNATCPRVQEAHHVHTNSPGLQ